MSALDYSQPPRDLPVYVKYLLGLAQDAPREQIEREWAAQITPLLNIGPEHLYNRESLSLMAGGLTGTQARRIFAASKRGQFLANSMERENAARRRAIQSKPPFARLKQ